MTTDSIHDTDSPPQGEPHTNSTTFGLIFREQRQYAGYTQRELAKLLDVDFTYLSKIENDALEHPPSVRLVTTAAAIFGCDPAWFVGQAKQIDTDSLFERVRNEPLFGEFLFLMSQGWLTPDHTAEILATYAAGEFDTWAAMEARHHASAARTDAAGTGGGDHA